MSEIRKILEECIEFGESSAFSKHCSNEYYANEKSKIIENKLAEKDEFIEELKKDKEEWELRCNNKDRDHNKQKLGHLTFIKELQSENESLKKDISSMSKEKEHWYFDNRP